MAKKKPGIGHNSTSAAELQAIVERIEAVEVQQEELKDDKAQIYAEAKGRGFATRIIRKIIAKRKQSEWERQEEEALMDIYMAALGMLDGTPLGKSALERMMRKPPDDKKPEGEGGQEGEPDGDDKGESGQGGIGGDTFDTETGEIFESVTPEQIKAAHTEGTEAAKAGKKIISNPYPARDLRRAAWDEGFCQHTGSDGMEIPDAWRPRKKPEEKNEGDDKK